jgi:hypothetical protein
MLRRHLKPGLLNPATAPHDDPDAVLPPSRWLLDVNARLGDLVASVGGSGSVVDCCVSLGRFCAWIEIDHIPVPEIDLDGRGGVYAEWRSRAGGVQVSATRERPRTIAVTAIRGISPAPLILARRDGVVDVLGGTDSPGAPRGPMELLRRGLARVVGWEGLVDWELAKDAAGSRKLSI